ncbi:hypothetical protein HGK72_30825 [Mycolicibacterium fortuitum]|uniref:hypothetical protein n=1 Tax=Mycolicibacterium fortuitum TaxID=1766 RepID=UPI00148FBE32|nr:hypothetical protein [Mycolicibacterium fortuitum]
MPALKMNHNYSRALKALAAVGIEPPKEYGELHGRLTAFEAIGTPQTDKLIAAIVAGYDDDELAVDWLHGLRADAIAEASAVKINTKVRDAVTAHSIGILNNWAPYSEVQAKFNDAWSKFVAAADRVDVDETDSEVIGGLETKQLSAWRDAKGIAEELNNLIEALAVAAQLSDRKVHPAWNDDSPSEARRYGDNMLELGLVVDPIGQHVRRLWEAYSAEGRCGAWAGLHRLGVTVKAKDLADYEPQRRPRPLLERRTDEGVVIVDPEDALVETAAAGE